MDPSAKRRKIQRHKPMTDDDINPLWHTRHPDGDTELVSFVDAFPDDIVVHEILSYLHLGVTVCYNQVVRRVRREERRYKERPYSSSTEETFVMVNVTVDGAVSDTVNIEFAPIFGYFLHDMTRRCYCLFKHVSLLAPTREEENYALNVDFVQNNVCLRSVVSLDCTFDIMAMVHTVKGAAALRSFRSLRKLEYRSRTTHTWITELVRTALPNLKDVAVVVMPRRARVFVSSMQIWPRCITPFLRFPRVSFYTLSKESSRSAQVRTGETGKFTLFGKSVSTLSDLFDEVDARNDTLLPDPLLYQSVAVFSRATLMRKYEGCLFRRQKGSVCEVCREACTNTKCVASCEQCLEEIANEEFECVHCGEAHASVRCPIACKRCVRRQHLSVCNVCDGTNASTESVVVLIPDWLKPDRSLCDALTNLVVSSMAIAFLEEATLLSMKRSGDLQQYRERGIRVFGPKREKKLPTPRTEHVWW